MMTAKGAANARMLQAKRDFISSAVAALYCAVNGDADAVQKTTDALAKLNAVRADINDRKLQCIKTKGTMMEKLNFERGVFELSTSMSVTITARPDGVISEFDPDESYTPGHPELFTAEELVNFQKAIAEMIRRLTFKLENLPEDVLAVDLVNVTKCVALMVKKIEELQTYRYDVAAKKATDVSANLNASRAEWERMHA